MKRDLVHAKLGGGVDELIFEMFSVILHLALNSPRTDRINFRSLSQPSSPATQADIEQKLAAAAARRQMLDTLRVKNISDKLAKAYELGISDG